MTAAPPVTPSRSMIQVTWPPSGLRTGSVSPPATDPEVAAEVELDQHFAGDAFRLVGAEPELQPALQQQVQRLRHAGKDRVRRGGLLLVELQEVGVDLGCPVRVEAGPGRLEDAAQQDRGAVADHDADLLHGDRGRSYLSSSLLTAAVMSVALSIRVPSRSKITACSRGMRRFPSFLR